MKDILIIGARMADVLRRFSLHTQVTVRVLEKMRNSAYRRRMILLKKEMAFLSAII